MRDKRHVLFFILFLLSGSIAASLAVSGDPGGERPSPELLKLGKELFTTKDRLGTKYACILCHQKEKAIKKSSLAKLGDKLPEAINARLLKESKGTKPLARNSEEMKALEAYITHEQSV